jgi:integrase/recombinase XerD
MALLATFRTHWLFPAALPRESNGARDRRCPKSRGQNQARSRHASVGFLERYARPGVDAVARHVAERTPLPVRRG